VNADGLHGATSDQPFVSLNLGIICDDLSSEAGQNIIQREQCQSLKMPHQLITLYLALMLARL